MRIPQTINVISKFPKNKSILIRGIHGIGKSSLVRQAMDLMATKEGVKYTLKDIRLSQSDVGDVRGLPFTSKKVLEDGEEVMVTSWAKPSWFPLDKNSHGILFLDELNRAPRDVLQVVFQLVLDRELDGVKLPDGWMVIAAVNANTEYHVNSFDPALLDRLFVIDLDAEVKDWLTYLSDADIHPAVLQYCTSHQEHVDPPIGGENSSYEPDKIYPSRRSWVALSETLTAMFGKDYNKPIDAAQAIHIAKGWVGKEIAISFQQFLETEYGKLDPSKVLDLLHEPHMMSQIKHASSRSEVISSINDGVLKDFKARLKKANEEVKKLPNSQQTERFEQLLTKQVLDNFAEYLFTIPKDVGSIVWREVNSFADKGALPLWCRKNLKGERSAYITGLFIAGPSFQKPVEEKTE